MNIIKLKKRCIFCKKEFVKNKKYSSKQWKKVKFCSQQCFADWWGKQYKGTIRPQKDKDKISKTMKKYFKEHPEIVKKRRQAWLGNKNPAYIDGKTPQNIKLRNNTKYMKWARLVKERDNYICKKCGGQHKKRKKIHAHHTPFSIARLAGTKFEKYLYNIRNGITLCVRCHMILENKIRRPIVGNKSSTNNG